MSEARLIKKYGNRKLYDTSDSSYITLKEILTLVNEGKEPIQVIDNKTKQDITPEVLFAAVGTDISAKQAISLYVNSNRKKATEELTLLLVKAATESFKKEENNG